MFKVTPNPPNTGPVPYDVFRDLDPKKMTEAADRALSFYLNPGASKTQIPPPHRLDGRPTTPNDAGAATGHHVG